VKEEIREKMKKLEVEDINSNHHLVMIWLKEQRREEKKKRLYRSIG